MRKRRARDGDSEDTATWTLQHELITGMAGPLPVSVDQKAGKAAIVLKRKARRRQDNTDLKQAHKPPIHPILSHKMAAKIATSVASVFGSSAVSASTIRQNCRKVICIGRNYA